MSWTGNSPYHYSLADFEHNTVRAMSPLPSGKVVVKLEYTSKGLKPGGTLNSGATVKLFVNGTVAGEGTVGSAMIRQGIEPFEIGRDSISPVSPDYKAKGSFPFTGTKRSRSRRSPTWVHARVAYSATCGQTKNLKRNAWRR
jgi:hypothetical protein